MSLNKFNVISIQLIIVAMVGILSMVSHSIYCPGRSAAIIWLSAFVLWIQLLWMCYSWAILRKNFYDPYALILIMILITHGGIPLLTLFSIAPDIRSIFTYRWIASIKDINVIMGNYLIAVSCAFMHLGASIALLHNKPPDYSVSRNSEHILKIAGLFFVIISIIPAFLLISKIWSAYSSLGYLAYFSERHDVSTWSINLAPFLLVGSYYLFVSTNRFDKIKILSLILICGYCIGFLIIGSRSRALLPIIAMVWLAQRYSNVIRRSLRWGVPVLLPVGVIVTYFISISRLDPSLSFFDVICNPSSLGDAMRKALSQYGIYSHIVYTVLENVPSNIDFTWGRSYLNCVFFVIPNLFFERSTHWGVDFSVQNWLVKDYLYPILRVNPDHNVGWSFVAEGYQAFGWLGVPIIQCLLGYGIGYLSRLSDSRNPVVLASVACVLPYLLFFPRTTSWGTVRSVVWYGFLPLIFLWFLSKVRTHPGQVESYSAFRGY